MFILCFVVVVQLPTLLESDCFSAIVFFATQMSIFAFPQYSILLVGLTGLEPVTPRLSSACSNQLSYRPGFGSLSRNWWRHGDSNPGHPACKAGALPTELYPQLRFSVKKGRHARRARFRSRRLAVYTSLVRCGPSRVPLSLPSGRDPTCALPCTCSIERR